MGPVLHGLIKLQRVENRLRAVKSKLSRCRRTVIFQENQLRTFQNEFEAKKEEIKLTKVQVGRLELELKERDEQISKLRSSLNLAKTNREYSAILTELNIAKADDSKIESQVLELMKNVEADESQCAELQKQIDLQKEKLAELRKETEEKAGHLEKQIETIQLEWQQASIGISPEAMDVFTRVAETYDGDALAIAGKQIESAEVFSCGGCFMGIPTEIINKLMTKDEIIRCANCTRILVLNTSEES